MVLRRLVVLAVLGLSCVGARSLHAADGAAALPPLPPRRGAVVERVFVDPAYPLPGVHMLTCRIALRGAGPAEIVWRRNGAEIGRGPSVSATLALGDEVTCEVVINGAVVARHTVRASRMGQLADLNRAPARPVVTRGLSAWRFDEPLPEHGEQLIWAADQGLWRTDGSSERTELLPNSKARSGFSALIGDGFVTEELGGDMELLYRLDYLRGLPALDLRAQGPRTIMELASGTDGETYAAVRMHRRSGGVFGYEVWRVASATRPQALLWSGGAKSLPVNLYPHRGGVTLVAGRGNSQVIRLDEFIGQSYQTVLFKGPMSYMLSYHFAVPPRCVLTGDAKHQRWTMQRIEAGRLITVAPAPGFGEIVDAGDGCAMLYEGDLIIARGGALVRYPLPSYQMPVRWLDGTSSVFDEMTGELWELPLAPPARAVQPWATPGHVRLYQTKAARQLVHIYYEESTLYARDPSGGWRRLWSQAPRDLYPLGVVDQRAIWDVDGALYAAALDGSAVGLLEPWATEGSWPQVAFASADDRASAFVYDRGDRVWRLDGAIAQLQPGKVHGRSNFIAAAGGVTVIASRAANAFVYVYPDGRTSEGRRGIARGAMIGEVFAWRGSLFTVVLAPRASSAEALSPPRIYKLGAGEVWSEHARGPAGTQYAGVERQQGGRVLLHFRARFADGPRADLELTGGGLGAAVSGVVAMTPTRTLVHLSGRRCVLVEADGRTTEALFDLCIPGSVRVRGEAMSLVRLASRALEVWWMSPGEAAPTLRTTLPAQAWHPDLRVGAMTDDAVYFVWWTPERGEELWVWDERGGARVVADLWPGVMDSRPTGLQVIGGALYFTATSPDGRGVWRIGATGQAPQLLHAPVPGVSPSEVLYMQPDGRLLFSAHSPEYGEELWALEP